MAKQRLKRWLVPHHTNNYHPKIFTIQGTVLVLLLLFIFQLGYNWIATGKPKILGFASSITQPALLSDTNAQRNVIGLPPLADSPVLDQAAAAKAQNMLADNYWAHVSPTGTTPWYFFTAAGYQYQYAGENLAKDFDTSSGVVAAWMASADHRANILNTHYTQVGFAIANGNLQGEDTTLVVAFYGDSQPAITTAAAINTGSGTSLEAASSGVGHLTPGLVNAALNWGAKLLIAVLAILLLLYINAHVVRRRRRIAGHKITYSASQAAIYASLIVIIVITSLGTIR